MKCLQKYTWVKLPRNALPSGKGLMEAWMRLASRAAFRKGVAYYSDNISPKTLRHFFCSHALESGFSIHEVSNLAGHSSIQVTMLYTNPTAQAMKDKANKL